MNQIVQFSNNFGVFYNRLSEVQKKYIISLQLPQNITNNLLLQILQECPNLEELSCWECDQITGVGFDRLPDGLELKKLIFSSCPITDANLLSLMQKCPNLEELTCEVCDQITGVGFDRLPNGLGLKKLDFSYCPITNANLLSLIRKCPNLEELRGKTEKLNILNFIRSEEKKLWEKQVKTVVSFLAISILLSLEGYLISKFL